MSVYCFDFPKLLPEPRSLMSHPNPFHQVWPPRSNDDFDAWPEVREARRMFRAHVTSLGELAAQAAHSPTGAETRRLAHELAAMLHDIAGTAAYFGEASFGTFAGELERQVRSAFTADLLRPLCASIQARLAQDEIDRPDGP